MDTTPGSGGLVDKLGEIRNYLNILKTDNIGNPILDLDGNQIFEFKMKKAEGKRMTGVKAVQGFHGQYDGCLNCANPYDGSVPMTTHNGLTIDKRAPSGTLPALLNDGSEVFQINNPSVKCPNINGWNEIKDSGSLSPQQVVDNILNDNSKWGYQQKTNQGYSTYYPQNLTTAQYEEIIAAAKNEYDLTIGGVQYIDVLFKGKKLNIRIVHDGLEFHTAFVYDVFNP